jgi:hypothetical protein
MRLRPLTLVIFANNGVGVALALVPHGTHLLARSPVFGRSVIAAILNVLALIARPLHWRLEHLERYQLFFCSMGLAARSRLDSHRRPSNPRVSSAAACGGPPGLQ